MLLSSMAASGLDNKGDAASGSTNVLTASPVADWPQGDIGTSGQLLHCSGLASETNASEETSARHFTNNRQLQSRLPSARLSFVGKVKDVGSSFVNKLLKSEHKTNSNLVKPAESAWFLDDGSLNDTHVENVNERDLDDNQLIGSSCDSEAFKINYTSGSAKCKAENNETNDLISNIRRLECDNFHVDEILLARVRAENNSAALAWLQSDWLVMQNALHSSAINHFPELETVVRSPEIKTSLIATSGDVQESIKHYRDAVNYRIESMSQFLWISREAVSRVLRANAGDWVEASHAVHEAAIKNFCSKWKSDEENFSAVTLAEIAELLRHIDDRPRKVRLLLAELQLPCWADGECVLRLWEHFAGNDTVTLGDIVEAQATCSNLGLDDMIAFLQWECVICSGQYPASKFFKLAMCECRICKGCMQGYYSVQIKEMHATRWACPACQSPDMTSNDADVHLQFLDSMLKAIVSVELHELFEKKLRDWHLTSDVNFRWCQGGGAGCGSGSIYTVPQGQLRVVCQNCGKAMCFMCKKPWEAQHENVSCELFASWKRDNDPQQQAQALWNFLEENGIDCPQCKYRFALAKGGCMHFKCNRCTHEFCCGCSEPFRNGSSCRKFATCAAMGLHCHHPRDCLFYMRDMSIDSLCQLLRTNNVSFERERQAVEFRTCTVMEQKEDGTTLRDKACGREVLEGCGGLCEVHYKEYLVGLINKRGIDPVTVWSLDDMENELKRNNKALPIVVQWQTEVERKLALVRVIQEELPLLRSRNVLMFS